MNSGFWWAVPFCLGAAALGYTFFTGRTPNRFTKVDRATRPFWFWFDIVNWALITLVGAGLIAYAYLGWWR